MKAPNSKPMLASPHMAYTPRSKPNFQGDIQHDVRDFLLDHRAVTLGMITGRCVDAYLRVAALVAAKDDPLADCLVESVQFDMRTLQIAHDHLAAFWRCQNFPIRRASPAPRVNGERALVTPQDCLNGFRTWLRQECAWWAAENHIVIRLFCLVLVQQNTAQGYLAEITLFERLCAIYPLKPSQPAARH